MGFVYLHLRAVQALLVPAKVWVMLSQVAVHLKVRLAVSLLGSLLAIGWLFVIFHWFPSRLTSAVDSG